MADKQVSMNADAWSRIIALVSLFLLAAKSRTYSIKISKFICTLKDTKDTKDTNRYQNIDS